MKQGTDFLIPSIHRDIYRHMKTFLFISREKCHVKKISRTLSSNMFAP